MHREGHYGAALVLYAPVAFVVAVIGGVGLAAVLGAGVAWLSMLPDWDMKLPFIKHRGITHTWRFFLAATIGGAIGGTVLGLVAGGVLAAVVGGLLGGIVLAIAVGSHLLADMLTPMGVDVHETGERISYELTTAGNPIANYVLLALGAGATLVGVTIGAAVPV